MPTIVRRHGPRGRRYQVRIRTHGRARSATFPTLRAARHWATATEALLRQGRLGPLPAEATPTVGDLPAPGAQHGVTARGTRSSSGGLGRRGGGAGGEKGLYFSYP